MERHRQGREARPTIEEGCRQCLTRAPRCHRPQGPGPDECWAHVDIPVGHHECSIAAKAYRRGVESMRPTPIELSAIHTCADFAGDRVLPACRTTVFQFVDRVRDADG